MNTTNILDYWIICWCIFFFHYSRFLKSICGWPDEDDSFCWNVFNSTIKCKASLVPVVPFWVVKILMFCNRKLLSATFSFRRIVVNYSIVYESFIQCCHSFVTDTCTIAIHGANFITFCKIELRVISISPPRNRLFFIVVVIKTLY